MKAEQLKELGFKHIGVYSEPSAIFGIYEKGLLRVEIRFDKDTNKQTHEVFIKNSDKLTIKELKQLDKILNK